MSRESKEIIVGRDIGTSKIVALVAEITPEGRLNIIGMGSQDSKGLKKGVVVNIEDTVATISRVLQEVELMADCKVKEVYTGIAGSHIKSFNSNGMVAIKDKEVTTLDVDRVIETARAVNIPMEQQVLHILVVAIDPDGQIAEQALRHPDIVAVGAFGLRQGIEQVERRVGGVLEGRQRGRRHQFELRRAEGPGVAGVEGRAVDRAPDQVHARGNLPGGHVLHHLVPAL